VLEDREEITLERYMAQRHKLYAELVPKDLGLDRPGLLRDALEHELRTGCRY